MSQDSAQGSGARMLSILRCIAEGPPEFSLKEISGRAGLPPSTVHRLLKVMLEWDIVERAGAQQYRIGRDLFRIASLLLRNYDVRRQVRPILETLRDDWQETTLFCLYRPAARTAIVADIAHAVHRLRVVLEPSEEISLAWGSLGRSILAYLPPEQIEQILSTAGVAPISGRPLPPRTKLNEELDAIRREGVAVFQDNDTNLAGVSAPAFSPDRGVTGCVGLVLPASRMMEQDMQAMRQAVKDAAGKLSTAMGAGAPAAR